MLDSNAQCYRDIEKKVRRSRAEGSPRKEAERLSARGLSKGGSERDGLPRSSHVWFRGYLTPRQSLGQLMSERLLVTFPERPSNRASSPVTMIFTIGIHQY